MSTAITRGVRVDVVPHYHPNRSDPLRGYWFFSYQVTLTNLGDVAVQLVSRHWIITDSSGQEEHVRGPGVVGETPKLLPGESFHYASACPLGTSMGSMHGSFQMLTSEGEKFDATVAPFVLSDPLDMN